MSIFWVLPICFASGVIHLSYGVRPLSIILAIYMYIYCVCVIYISGLLSYLKYFTARSIAKYI